jgi:hypothetical protein
MVRYRQDQRMGRDLCCARLALGPSPIRITGAGPLALVLSRSNANEVPAFASKNVSHRTAAPTDRSQPVHRVTGASGRP